MKEGANFKRPNSQARINIDLQLNLFNTWIKYGVAEYYQNIFLAYLDEQNAETIEKEIKRQIKQTIQKNTLFFKVENLQQERYKQLASIQKMLLNKEQEISPQEMVPICQQLSKLRNLNLQITENLIKMHQKFRCYANDSLSKQTPFYETLFEELDKQNQFIKDSVLNRYIQFGDGYDPFLMNPYEKYHRSGQNNQLEAIKSLFNLNISYAYRLIRAKNSIVEIRSKLKEPQTIKMSSIATNKLNKYKNKKQNDEQMFKFVPQSKTYEQKADFSSKKQSYSQYNHPIKIAPIKVYPYVKRAKSTFDAIDEFRTKSSSLTEKGYDLVFSRLSKTDSIQNSNYHKRHLPTEPDIISRSSYYNRKKYQTYKLQPIKIEKKIQDDQRHQSISRTNRKNIKQFSNQKTVNRNKFQISKQFQIKETPNAQQQKTDLNDMNTKRQKTSQQPQKSKTIQLPPIQKECGYDIRHYNPIKKSQFQIVKRQNPSLKYDFIAPRQNNITFIEQQSDDSGLNHQNPIFKYNKKGYLSKKHSTTQPQKSIQNSLNKKQVKNQPKIQKKTSQIKKVQQQSQTMQIQSQLFHQKNNQYQLYQNTQENQKNNNNLDVQSTSRPKTYQNNISPIETQLNNPKPQQILNNEPKTSQNQNSQPYQQKNSEVKPSHFSNSSTQPPHNNANYNQNFPVNSNNQPTINNNNIQSQPNSANQTNPATNPTNISKVPVNNPTTQQQINAQVHSNPPETFQTQTIPKSTQNQVPSVQTEPVKNTEVKKQAQKKEIRMKIGKSTIAETITLLQTSPIKPQYKNLFSMERLIQLIKVSQVYLTEFHINNSCAVIALSSPIPGIGMAIKLWAPINPTIDEQVSSNLFLKYIQYIQKSTSVQKIMFSGNGEAFQELKSAQFVKKKENLYERLRKLPAKMFDFEFKPFLQVGCSTVNFNQSGTETMLFSQQIQQFDQNNSHVSDFIAQIDKKTIPSALQPLIKIDQNLVNFEAVNRILTAEQLDNYQAGDMKISSINLLRFLLNTHFKTSFIACDGFFQFVGNLIYQKGEQRIISIQTSKNNGNVFFAKNMPITAMIQKRNTASNNKVKFCVKMFHKALYGKLPKNVKGCYANWEINLTWEDEMQGKIKHNLPQGVTFGPQNFCIGIQVQKQLLYCAVIKKEDFIY